MKRFFLSLLLAVFALVLTLSANAQTRMTATGMAQKPVNIILDADFGSSTDDLFALMMLHRYVDEGRANLLGVICDREGEKNAEVADILNTYYGHPDTPIGLERNGVKNPRVFIPYNGIADLKDTQGKPLFARTHDSRTLPDGYKLYRRLLSKADDHSVVIVAIGFATTLSELFDSKADEHSPLSGIDLFVKKAKAVYIQAGRFQAGDSLCGYNMRAASRHSANFYNRFPKNVELVFSPSNVGDGMDYPPRDVLTDLSSTELNPIKAAYTYYNCDTGQRMWDTNCLVQAVEGDDGYLLSPRGWATFIDRGEESLLLFREDAKGNARYQLLGDSYYLKDKVMDIRRMTRLTPNPSAYTIEAPQPQITGKQAADWTRPRLQLLADKYMGSAGNKLDPDDIRQLFYPLGYTGPNWKDYDEAERMVVDYTYERMLQKAIHFNKKSMVIVTGAPGVGKSYAVKQLKLKDAGLIYDAAFSGQGKLTAAIDKARAAGIKQITVVPVYNDILTSYKNTITRGQNTWRYTALDYMVSSFRANRGLLQKLRAQYPEVEIRPVNCSGNLGANKVSLDEALRWRYEVSEQELADLLACLREAIDNGEIENGSVAAATGDVLSIPGLGGANLAVAKQIDKKMKEIEWANRMKY